MVTQRPHTQTPELNDGEWNPWPVELRTGDESTGPAAPISHTNRPGDGPSCDKHAWHTIQTLETELERKERQNQRIIERYERVLEDKTHTTGTVDASMSDPENSPPILAKILRFVSDR